MSKNVLRLFFVSILVFSFSCAKKRVEIPVYEGANVRDILSSKAHITGIETTFSVTFERDDTEINGDGALHMSKNGDMNMRIYSFGFPVFQISSRDGIIKSNPVVDRNKGTLLTYGLRDCLFWWDIEDFSIPEKDDTYILKDIIRTVWIDRKTMLPVKQSVSLSDGKELIMHYTEPERMGDEWYPSKIRIELMKYAVILTIKEMSFNPAP